MIPSLIQSESGGNWQAQNNVTGAGGMPGHFGRLQFGQARLQDAMNAGVIPFGTTPQQFMANPQMQMAVEQWHFADIDRRAQDMGLTSYIGQTVGGAPITQDAIRAMAHLGGIGGAARFLESGGQYNPSDAFGTSLLDYAMQHGGNMQPTGGQPPMQQTQPQGLLGTMSSMSAPQEPTIWDALVGRLPEPVRGVAGRTIGNADWRDRMAIALAGMSMRPNTALIETLQGRMDERGEMARVNQTVQWLQSIGRTDLAEAVAAGSLMGDQAAAIAMQPPAQAEPTAMMQNYEFLLGQGYTPEQALAALQSGTVVNVGGEAGPEIGTIPPGAAFIPDPASPAGGRIVPIPGGPLDLEQQAAEAERLAADTQEALAAEGTATTANIVLRDINRLTELIETAPWYDPAVGRGTGITESLRGTNAADAKALAATIRANIGFDRLQQMREASPTGGALGAVTQNELDALQAVLGNLDLAQSEDQFMTNLQDLNNIYKGILNKLAAYPNAAEFGIVAPEGSIGVTTLPPADINSLLDRYAPVQ